MLLSADALATNHYPCRNLSNPCLLCLMHASHPRKLRFVWLERTNDQTERDNTVREVLGPLRLDAPSGLPELEDGNDCDGLRPTPLATQRAAPRPHRVHGKLRGDPVSTPVSESWWATMLPQQEAGAILLWMMSLISRGLPKASMEITLSGCYLERSLW